MIGELRIRQFCIGIYNSDVGAGILYFLIL